MKKLFVLAIAAALTLSAYQAEAVIIAPGNSSVLADASSPGGALQASLTDQAFSTGDVTGTYDTFVRLNATGLVFEYQFFVDDNVDGEISTVVMRDFSGWTTDVGADDVGDRYPVLSSRSGGSGITVRFFYTDVEVGPDEDSAFMWIQTNATHFKAGTFSLINGLTDDQEAFAPTVPEPTSMLLFGTGLLGFAGRLRKRFNA